MKPPRLGSELEVSKKPSALARAYRGWLALGRAIGLVTTPVLLAVVFVVVIVPTRLALAALRRDPLDARKAPTDGSWWADRRDRAEDFHRLA